MCNRSGKGEYAMFVFTTTGPGHPLKDRSRPNTATPSLSSYFPRQPASTFSATQRPLLAMMITLINIFFIVKMLHAVMQRCAHAWEKMCSFFSMCSHQKERKKQNAV
uniref:Uncharacterized protein n=1 Tax=Trypanosoma congolense (strain IL3000) TaxID=1068625 RepID=G0URW9_TRYCI|nr:hypothetical protein, unlikely [Trypanosoma congolense IL3000]